MIQTREIFIDFDGPVHLYSQGYKDGSIYDPPSDNVKDVIDILKKTYSIVIFTARVSKIAADAIDKSVEDVKKDIAIWLNKYNIHFDDITCEKRPAVMYIDDLAVNYDKKLGWKKTLKDVLEFLKENEK